MGERFTGPNGELIHAETRIGDSVVMITEDAVDGPVSSPERLGEMVTCVMSLYWEDVDAAWERAVGAGAEVIYPLEDQFYGERGGRLRDPFGQQWMIASTSRTSRPRRWPPGCGLLRAIAETAALAWLMTTRRSLSSRLRRARAAAMCTCRLVAVAVGPVTERSS